MTDTDPTLGDVPEATMRDALTRGDARPLSHTVTDIVHWRGGWWATYPAGWLCLRDKEVIGQLDAFAVRIAQAETAAAHAAARHRAHRDRQTTVPAEGTTR